MDSLLKSTIKLLLKLITLLIRKQERIEHEPKLTKENVEFEQEDNYRSICNKQQDSFVLLKELHQIVALSYLIKEDLFGTNPFFPIITPFNMENKFGFFTYAVGRDCYRYSRVYDKFSIEKVIYGYTLEKTNSLILICQSINIFRACNTDINKINIPNTTDFSNLKKYCVFQDPFSKIVQYGSNDILKDFDSLTEANEFAEKISRSENVTVLVAYINEKIIW